LKPRWGALHADLSVGSIPKKLQHEFGLHIQHASSVPDFAADLCGGRQKRCYRRFHNNVGDNHIFAELTDVDWQLITFRMQSARRRVDDEGSVFEVTLSTCDLYKWVKCAHSGRKSIGARVIDV
jgi:hypothetical protein